MVNKKTVGLLTLGIIVAGASLFGVGVTAVSALNREKAEKLAELTDKSVEEVIEERYNDNKTYGEIAEENGVLEEFQEQNQDCDGTGNGIHSNNHDYDYTEYHPAHYHQYSNGRGYGQGYGHRGQGYGYRRHHQ